MSSAVQIHIRNTLVYVSKRFQRLIGPQEHLFWFLNTNFREDLYFAAQLSSEHKTSVGGGVSVTSRLYLLPMVPAVIPETCYYIHYFYNFFKPLFTFLESSNYFSLNQKVSSTIYIANNTKERKQNWDEYFSRVLIIQQKNMYMMKQQMPIDKKSTHGQQNRCGRARDSMQSFRQVEMKVYVDKEIFK